MQHKRHMKSQIPTEASHENAKGSRSHAPESVPWAVRDARGVSDGRGRCTPREFLSCVVHPRVAMIRTPREQSLVAVRIGPRLPLLCAQPSMYIFVQKTAMSFDDAHDQLTRTFYPTFVRRSAKSGNSHWAC